MAELDQDTFNVIRKVLFGSDAEVIVGRPVVDVIGEARPVDVLVDEGLHEGDLDAPDGEVEIRAEVAEERRGIRRRRALSGGSAAGRATRSCTGS